MTGVIEVFPLAPSDPSGMVKYLTRQFLPVPPLVTCPTIKVLRIPHHYLVAPSCKGQQDYWLPVLCLG